MNRFSVLSRVVAGTLGAYAIAALGTAALARILIAAGSDPVEATLGSTLASFAVFCGISIAVFHAEKVQRAWAWLILSAVPLSAALGFLPALS